MKKARIDNTFFSKKNYRNVDLRRVYKFMQKSRKFHVEYNVELFAGMYLKPKQKYYPTILFFSAPQDGEKFTDFWIDFDEN